ncbi:MAG: ABC transporter substrate-binding protein [Clostridia bacterium]|nr:ABC transporter substrate-binding protein [Clostridia bacterium]
MKKLKIAALLVAATILACVGLSACSTDISGRKNDDTSTLYVGYVGTSFPTSFMPWLSRDGIAPTVCSMIYSTLFSYDSATAEYEPLLAKQWCYVDLYGNALTADGTFDGETDYDAVADYYNSISEDYMFVRIELFDGILWTDGVPFTVEDVYYSFDVATDYTFSNHAGALAWTADLQHESSGGTVVNQGMYTAAHPDYSGTLRIDEDEKDTVIYLKVNKVLGAVTTLFTSILILPEHIWKPLVNANDQLNNKNPEGEFLSQYRNPVGCGPWILNRSQTNTQMITLDRNPNFHLKDENGNDLYKVEKIKLLLYMDQNTAIFSIRKGYIDVLDSSVSSNYLSLFEADENIQILRAEGTYTSCLVLNVNPSSPYNSGMKTLFGDINFRKAIALAVNQEELIDKILDGAGQTASAGLILSSSEIYEPRSDVLRGDYEENIALANSILDEKFPQKDASGYRLYNGSKISFEILTSTVQQDLVAYLQRQFQRIGIDVQFKASGSSPETTYIYKSNFDMTVQSVTLSVSTADTMYKAHFVTTERSSNYGKYGDGELTALINKMRETLNYNEKISLIKELQIKVAESYYKIPLYSSEVLSVARCDRFTGYTVDSGETAFNNTSLQNLVRL